jgi:hypothetical protein
MGASAVKWKSEPEQHDYPAAESYLSLVLSPRQARAVVEALRVAPIEYRKAKDILRASRLERLGGDNPHVHHDLGKIHDGTALSPILLVRGDVVTGRALTIADGYHRVCASFLVDENTDIPCRIVDLGV